MPVIQKNRKRLLYYAGADLTIDGVVENPELGNEPVDVTTQNDAARRMEPGMQTVSVAYSGLFATGVGRAYTVLTDALGEGGSGNAAAFYANGDGSGQVGIGVAEAWVESAGFQGGPGEAESIDANFVQDGRWDNVVSLGPLGTITADALTGTYDRGVGQTSTSGGIAYVQVFGNAAVGANTQWIIRLQDAVTGGGAYSDVATLTISSGTLTGTALEFTGLFNRFVRGSMEEDSTTGTLSFQLSFAAR